MVRGPLTAAKIAKLIFTTTFYMRTPFSPLHHEFALLTSSEIEMLLQKISVLFIIITLPLVSPIKTLQTVLHTTNHTNYWFLLGDDITWASLIRAESFVRIIIH
jgi:hypothetical protein